MRWISIGDFRFSSEEKEAINKVLESNRITEHLNVLKFENAFSKYLNNKYTILTNSGTSSLILGLASLKECDVKPNTNIITTPLTYVATINAIKLTGFNPIFVDVDPQTFVITPKNISEALEKIDDLEKYSIILPVHLMGYPADMDEINIICKKHGLISFEDSAQAHGSEIMGRKCGSMSTVAAFSFYIAHNIQVGEMGALTTNDINIVKLARSLKANGRMCDCKICTRAEGTCPHRSNTDIDPRFTHSYIGYNFKTTEFMASIGLAQLNRVESIIQKRQENVKVLNEGLESFSDLIQLPKYSDDVSYMAYPIVVKENAGISRDSLRVLLEKNGVETRPLFSCVPTQQPSFEYLKDEYLGKLPNAEYLGKNGFYIGCHQFLKEEDLGYIIESFKKNLA